MYAIFSILIILVCILLILMILVQNPKGGGLSSSFGGSNQMFGVQKTTDFLDKGTWTLAIALVSLILLSNFAIDRNTVIEEDSNLRDQIENAAPAMPSTPPVEQNTQGEVEQNTPAQEVTQ